MESEGDNGQKQTTEITFELPFCLYKLDERFFDIGDEYNTKIKFIRHKIEPSRRTAHSENVEFLRDRWGIDGYSSAKIETEKHLQEVENVVDFVLPLVNNFLKLYRYFDEDAVHIFKIIKDDLFNLTFGAGRHFATAIGFGGGIRTLIHEKVATTSNKIQEAFSKNIQIPLWQELLLNAQYYSFIYEYKMTILETIIALELVLSDFIRTNCKSRGISEEDADNYISDVGLTGNVKVNVRLFLENNNLPDDTIFQKCKAGITIRNAIMHKGRTEVSEQEARETFDATIKMIKALGYNLGLRSNRFN